MIGFLVDPRAHYRMQELYETWDCQVLFGPQVQAGDFSDDALGRALLTLHAANPAQMFADLSERAIATYALPPTDAVHADTTSLTLYGKYPAPEAADTSEGDTPVTTDAPGDEPDAAFAPPETTRSMRGYNKDGHRDCKQLALGAVTRPDGIPVWVGCE